MLNEADVALLAVDGYFEAAKIRDVTKHPILVMGYILPQNIRLLDIKQCSFVVQDRAGLEVFAALGRQVRIHLEFNTGMNRLGLKAEELENYIAFLKQHPKLQLEGVMTHLADADNPTNDAFSHYQIEAFDVMISRILKAGFRPKFIHAFQTTGTVKVASNYANAFRLGIGLYGLNPLEVTDDHFHDFDPLRPVLELKSTLIKVLELQKGDRVSYNGIFTAPKKMKIAVLPLGYYEGVPRALSNCGTVSYRDKQLPIVGRVCMNHTMIDISGVGLKVGDQVMVISNDPTQPNSIAGWQANNNLFLYNSVTSLAETIRRVVLS